jgi:hypothetical protein
VVELAAYAADCRVSGLVEVGDGRVSDLLNDNPAIVFRDARLNALEDGHSVEVPELEVGRDELYAVVAAGSRGDPDKRVHTRRVRVEAAVGPYMVRGFAHSSATFDPFIPGLRRVPWVPVTDATVRYLADGQPVVELVGTLMVNRPLATRFAATTD